MPGSAESVNNAEEDLHKEMRWLYETFFNVSLGEDPTFHDLNRDIYLRMYGLCLSETPERGDMYPSGMSRVRHDLFVNFDDSDNKHGNRRIVASAVLFERGQKLAVSVRHHDNAMRLQMLGHARYVGMEGRFCQGFICNYSHFLTRRMAYPIAEAAGQILYPNANAYARDNRALFSELLY